MEKLAELAKDPAFWFVTVLLSLFLNVASQYLFLSLERLRVRQRVAAHRQSMVDREYDRIKNDPAMIAATLSVATSLQLTACHWQLMSIFFLGALYLLPDWATVVTGSISVLCLLYGRLLSNKGLFFTKVGHRGFWRARWGINEEELENTNSARVKESGSGNDFRS